ncbi:hypothetical protein RF11_09181 [Thelohanellus kitauei]|uniref:Uncharacterized protein n=1 Tax=Thelohanellus kitauei TaxID=669202 RepID=A0A0C2MV08_THEKT|nr:hypothetical protein RF11_09181 [Thelohanellus kitauei]
MIDHDDDLKPYDNCRPSLVTAFPYVYNVALAVNAKVRVAMHLLTTDLYSFKEDHIVNITSDDSELIIRFNKAEDNSSSEIKCVIVEVGSEIEINSCNMSLWRAPNKLPLNFSIGYRYIFNTSTDYSLSSLNIQLNSSQEMHAPLKFFIHNISLEFLNSANICKMNYGYETAYGSFDSKELISFCKSAKTEYTTAAVTSPIHLIRESSLPRNTTPADIFLPKSSSNKPTLSTSAPAINTQEIYTTRSKSDTHSSSDITCTYSDNETAIELSQFHISVKAGLGRRALSYSMGYKLKFHTKTKYDVSNRVIELDIPNTSSKISIRFPQTKLLPPLQLYRHLRFPLAPDYTAYTPKFPPFENIIQQRDDRRLRKGKTVLSPRVLASITLQAMLPMSRSALDP